MYIMLVLKCNKTRYIIMKTVMIFTLLLKLIARYLHYLTLKCMINE